MGRLAGVERFGDGDTLSSLLWRKGIASNIEKRERYRGSMEVTGILSMAIAVVTNEHPLPLVVEVHVQ